MGLFNKNPSEKKEVKRLKPKKKEKVQLSYRKINQKMANRLLMGFVIGMVGLSALVISSNALRAVFGSEQVVLQPKKRDSRNLSNKVGLFMTDFLNAYFSDNSQESREKLEFFYGSGIDIKNNTSDTLASRLTGATLIEITDTKAIYRVAYAVNRDDEWQDNVGVIVIPYNDKDGKFYVSDLPYFIDEESYVAKMPKAVDRLKTQTDDKAYNKEKKYLEAFFKAYVSGDDTQLLPFSKTIKPVLGYSFKSMDYTYFVETGNRVKVAVQVTFEDGLGLSHQENFTLELSKGNDTFYVEKMAHGISEKMKKEMN